MSKYGINDITVTLAGVVVIMGLNAKGEEDTWYITEERLLRALSKVSTDDGKVMQASKRNEIDEGTSIKVRFES